LPKLRGTERGGGGGGTELEKEKYNNNNKRKKKRRRKRKARGSNREKQEEEEKGRHESGSEWRWAEPKERRLAGRELANGHPLRAGPIGARRVAAQVAPAPPKETSEAGFLLLLLFQLLLLFFLLLLLVGAGERAKASSCPCKCEGRPVSNCQAKTIGRRGGSGRQGERWGSRGRTVASGGRQLGCEGEPNC